MIEYIFSTLICCNWLFVSPILIKFRYNAHSDWLKKGGLWENKTRSCICHIMRWFSKPKFHIIRLKNTPLKLEEQDTNGKKTFKRMLSFLFWDYRESFWLRNRPSGTFSGLFWNATKAAMTTFQVHFVLYGQREKFMTKRKLRF